MMAKKKDVVTLKIESSVYGHQTKTLPVQEAVAEVENQTQEQGKWLYIDGKYTAVNTATDESKLALEASLREARDVTLAGTLLGGQ